MSLAEISSNVTSLSKQLSKLDRMLAKIGTAADSQSFRDQLNDEEKQTNNLVKNTLNGVRKCSQAGALKSPEGSRLLAQFNTEYERYQKLVKQLEAKQTIVLASAAKSYGDGTPLSLSLRQEADAAIRGGIQMDEIQFVEYDIQEVERRHQQIKELESDVVEVAQMYKDLHTLVHQQQATIDIIDNNIRDGRDQVESGHNQLNQAADYQAAIRRRKCIILIIFIIIIAIIIGVAVGVSK